MKQYDVVIVGGGPAGLKCAEVLAKGGKKVIVLEKNKIIGDKVCAGGVTLKDMELGIPNSIIERKFKGITIHTPLQNIELKDKKYILATLDRKGLGKWLAKKTKIAGAEIKLEAEVRKIDNRKITLKDNSKIGYDYLIGADGSNSMVRRFLGLENDKIAEAIHYLVPKYYKKMECFLNPANFGFRYLWIFPHKKITSIGCGSDLKTKGKVNVDIQKIRDELNLFCDQNGFLSRAKFQAATINYDYKGFDFGNKFLIGDAAGFASGLTGEGIYFAIKSGEDVAKKIINPKYNCQNIKHILKVKRFEEQLLSSLEINKALTEIEGELLIFLARMKWIDKEIIKSID